MAEQEIILEAQGLTKEFKGFVAVKNVSLRIRRHTIHALIGPNGAGKTTCFNLLTNFLTPTAGRISFNGRDITGSSPAAIARMGLVRSFQISAVFPHLSVRENVRVALQRKLAQLLPFLALRTCARRSSSSGARAGRGRRSAAFAELQAVELPYGRKRALEIATTLALDPEMLLLDEPMAGLGHEDIERITALIRSVAKDRTVLMVEHNLSVVADLCDRITVLARGEVLAEGTYARCRKDPQVRRSLCRDRPWLSTLLKVDDLQAWYGESTSCTASSSNRPRRAGDAARPQRRGQDHDVEVDHGHRRASAGAR